MSDNKQNINPRNANGERNGNWISYYRNKQIKFKGYFNNGKRNGNWIWHFSDGELYSKGEYANGKRVGMWKIWNWDAKEYDNIFY